MRQRPTASASSPQPGGPASTRDRSRVARRDLAERAHEAGQVLARLGRPDGEAVARWSRREQTDRARPRRLGVRARWAASGTPGMHDPHAGGVGPERVDHLARDEGRVGVDPGPPRQRPADQPGVGQRRLVAQLGVVERREVVHRDTVAARRVGRHHEVRAVHDVDRADEPLQPGRVPTPPQGMERPRRHRRAGAPRPPAAGAPR